MRAIKNILIVLGSLLAAIGFGVFIYMAWMIALEKMTPHLADSLCFLALVNVLTSVPIFTAAFIGLEKY